MFNIFENWIKTSEVQNRDTILDQIGRIKLEEEKTPEKYYSRFS